VIRRLNSWVLIALVVGGMPVRAADVAAGCRAAVEVASASPEALARLCRAVRATGASVQVARGGAWARVEIVSASRACLSAALAALQRRADASGLPVRSGRADPAGGIEAISAKPDGAARVSASAGGDPAAGVPAAPQPMDTCSRWAGRTDARARRPDAVAGIPAAPRGPPART